ncbi:MAG: hypothetical protein JWP03_5419 [Phycisphaerales bacterium]|nr:hypothetical protein [Phycisphaerales bacterium]
MSVGCPKFKLPPVVETVLSVEFDPIPGWGIPYFGLFWETIRVDFPRSESAPAYPPIIPSGLPGSVGIRFDRLDTIPARCIFFHRNNDRLIQVQADRFIHNWRKDDAQQPYLGYDAIRPSFEESWERFLEFLKAQELTRPTVRVCEVTYVNHILPGRGWSDFAHLGAVARNWNDLKTEFLPSPKQVAINIAYQMPAQTDGLTAQLQPAVRLSDASEIIQLTLTARGVPKSSDAADVVAWLDLGHEWVVKGFADVTAPKMQDVWNGIGDPNVIAD